jgi:DNA-directed RNA polymerase specialized sigma24 family protein
LQAILQHGAACASLNYDPGRGVPLAAHIYLRAVGAARTRYRQEWSYYLHFINELASSIEPIATSFDQASNEKELDQLLGKALNRLSVEDQWLIHQLFWDKADQCRVAARLHISQQCVSRRKARILRQLRRVLHKQSQLFLASWALLDNLARLPAINLL